LSDVLDGRKQWYAGSSTAESSNTVSQSAVDRKLRNAAERFIKFQSGYFSPFMSNDNDTDMKKMNNMNNGYASNGYRNAASSNDYNNNNAFNNGYNNGSNNGFNKGYSNNGYDNNNGYNNKMNQNSRNQNNFFKNNGSQNNNNQINRFQNNRNQNNGNQNTRFQNNRNQYNGNQNTRFQNNRNQSNGNRNSPFQTNRNQNNGNQNTRFQSNRNQNSRMQNNRNQNNRNQNNRFQNNQNNQRNGYQSNGYQSNGYQSNGYQSNGYQSNGYQSNGYNDAYNVLADDFVFRSPVIGPLSKWDYIDTVEYFRIYEAFPDINSNCYGFTVDPIDPLKVRFFVKATGTYQRPLGGFLGSATSKLNPPDGRPYMGATEAWSITFNDLNRMQIKSISAGYVVDRFEEEGLLCTTDGKGLIYGILNTIGLDFIPSTPGSSSLQLTQWLTDQFAKGGNGKDPLFPKAFSNRRDIPQWWSDKRLGAKK